MKKRSFLITSLLAVTFATFATSTLAQWEPRRPLNIIVPYGAGGGVDAFARAVSAAAKNIVPVPVVVVNKPGASGLVGAQAAASARPDGNIIMLTSAGSFLMASSLRQSKVNPFDDFQTIAQIGNLVAGVFVPADSPYKTINELVSAIKEHPEKLRWAHTGRGSFLHVAGQSFLDANDLRVGDVPFKGGAKVRAAVIGKQVDFGFIGVNVGRGFENNMRALAVATPERDLVMSDVPTLVERGLNYVDVSSPIVLFAPNGVAPEIIMAMERAMKLISETDTFSKLMLTKGNSPSYLSGQAARTKLQAMKEATTPILTKLRASK